MDIIHVILVYNKILVLQFSDWGQLNLQNYQNLHNCFWSGYYGNLKIWAYWDILSVFLKIGPFWISCIVFSPMTPKRMCLNIISSMLSDFKNWVCNSIKFKDMHLYYYVKCIKLSFGIPILYYGQALIWDANTMPWF